MHRNIYFPVTQPIIFIGQTALHRAARDGNVQACRMLLSAGADSSIVSLQGATAVSI